MDTLQREYNANFNMQSALQKQELETEQNVHAPYIQQQSQMVQAALVEQINPDKILDDLELRLRGFKRKYDGNLIKSGLPLMNDTGVMTMLTYASSVVNQHTIMSAYDKEQISKLIVELMNAVTDDLTLSWKEYGILQKSHIDLIHNIIMITCYSALNRALSGGERRFLGTTTIENISSMPKMNPIKKEGFLSRFRL